MAVLEPQALAAEKAQHRLETQSKEFELHVAVSSRRIKKLQHKLRRKSE